MNFIKVFGIDVVSIVDTCNVSNEKLLPRTSGVYILSYEYGDVYIGSTRDIRSRVSHWTSKKNLERIQHLKIYETRNKADAMTIEKILIHGTSPYLNLKIYKKNTYQPFEEKKHSNKRFVQNKDKKAGTVVISFPSKDTDFYPGDVVQFEVVSKGCIVIKKMESVKVIRDESTLNKVLSALGIGEHVTYRIKNTNEQIDTSTPLFG